jgi:hypothetical protein
MDSWSIHAVSDGHGHFALTNLPAGEYTVCTLIPTDSEDAASRVCLGDVFRRKDAQSVKVAGGEIADGVDIEIPLSGLHTVAGTVTALPDGHPVAHGAVRLLYADDREKAREAALQDDGSFSLEYVPEGKYILAVTGAHDEEQNGSAASQSNDAKPTITHVYADKEIPINVLSDMNDMNLTVAAPAPKDAAAPAVPQTQ